MKGRRDEMRLRYWSKITRMNRHKIPKQIYMENRRKIENGTTQEREVDTWCRYTRELLTELGLQQYWETGRLGTHQEWSQLVKDRIHKREEQKWKQQIEMKPKLRTYKTI